MIGNTNRPNYSTKIIMKALVYLIIVICIFWLFWLVQRHGGFDFLIGSSRAVLNGTVVG